jgi:hypothetical protein
MAFAVLLVPSTLMGATLSLLVAAHSQVRRGFGSALGRINGWNTLGAVVAGGITKTKSTCLGLIRFSDGCRKLIVFRSVLCS